MILHKNISYRQQNKTKNPRKQKAASEVPVSVPADDSEQREGVGEKAVPSQGRDPESFCSICASQSGRFRQEGLTLWRKEVAEDREEELAVEVSQNREVQQSGGGRAAWAAPRGPGPVIWLASWHKQSSRDPKTRQGKSQSIPP